MSFATGIHAHATYKVGLRPPEPGRPRLRLANYLTGKIPDHPAEADNLAGLSFGLYQNDRFGDCGPVSLANYVRMVTAKLTGAMEKPTQDAVFALYRQSGNPDFDPATGADDNGVNYQVMLQAAVEHGLGGHKVLGFAQVDTSNLDELDAAVALFGGILVGVNLQTAQQAQTDTGIWDWQPTPPWGGHAVLDGSFRASGGHRVITWAKPVLMTDEFIRRQESEAWVVVLPEHLGSRQFLDGVDVRSLAGDFEALTGRPFPAPLPPSPPVVPPTPSPTVTTFTGYAQIPLLGKAPIVLAQTSALGAPCPDCGHAPGERGGPAVGFSFPQLDVWALLSKYGQKVWPVVLSGILSKKAWKDILTDVLAVLAAA